MGSDSTRRALLRSTAGAGVVGLAGCLGFLEDDEPAGPEPENGEEIEVDPDQINIWHGMGGDLGDAFESMAEEFDGADELDIDFQGSYRDVLNNTLASIEAGTVPDIVQIARYETKQVLDTEAFQPVENVLPEDYPVDDLLPALVNYFTMDDTLQSMPFNNSNAILYYNASAFEEAGLDPESPPDTLEEVREYSEQLVDSGAVEYGFGWPNHMWFIEHWYALEDELLFDNENGRADDPTTIYLDEGVGVEVHEWWREMNEDDLFVNPGMEAWGEATELFTSQRAGMIMNTTAAVAGIVETAEEEGFEAGTHFHPTLGGRTGTPIGGGSFWVSGDVSDEKAERIGEFIAHMTQPDQQIFWHENTGYYPVREKAVTELKEEGWFEENPQYRTAFDQLQETEPTPATGGAMLGPSHSVRTIVQETSLDIVDERVEVDEGLSTAREEVEAELERYREVMSS